MSIEIRQFEVSLNSEWDDFIENISLNGTFLHTRKFYDHNPLNQKDDHSYLFYKKNKIIGVISFSLLETNNTFIFHSYLRATYGGFIISSEAGVQELIEMVELVIVEAKKKNCSEIIIRNPFRIFNKNSCDESDYAMWFHGFAIKYRELELAIQLGQKATVESNYADATRRSIQKGKKVLIAEESTEYEKYWQILDKNLADKHASKPVHSYQQFLVLLNKVGDKKIKLFVARLNGDIIAGILVFIVNENAIHAQYIASDLAYQGHRPLNVVIDHVIDWGCEHNFKYLNLGMANEDNGRALNSGLFRFKEGFGGRGVLRETMHLQLNNLQIG